MADLSSERPTVVVADDDLSIREDFTKLIEHDGRLELVGLARDGADAVDLVSRLEPDVAILDVRMPRLTGIEATEAIVERTGTSVLIVTTFDLDRDVRACIKAGASGFLLKTEAPDRMVDAALAVANGERVYNPLAIGLLVDALTSGIEPAVDDLNLLSARELDVLRLAASGRSNDEIAKDLFISISTVRTHMRSVLSKTGLNNRTQAVVWAYERRLVSPG